MLMLKRKIRNMQLTLWACDLMVILLSVQIAVLLTTGRVLLISQGFKSITVAYCFFLTVLFYITDLYGPRHFQKSYETASIVLLDAGISAALVTLSFYFVPYWHIGRGFFLVMFLSTPLLVMAERLLCSHLYESRSRNLTLGLLGTGPAMDDLRRVAEEHRLKVVNLPLMSDCHTPMAGQKQPVLSVDQASEFRNALTQLRPDIIVLKSLKSLDPIATKEIVDARFSGVPVLDFPTIFQMLTGKLPLEHMPLQWFLRGEGFRFFESTLAGRIKRLLDFVLACALTLASAPLFLLTALGIKLSSKGPFLDRQERVGLAGRIFQLFKFRTCLGEVDSQWLGSVETDSRVYLFGKFLRWSRLDGMPQLINVLIGDISFVGPRPLSPVLAEQCRNASTYHDLRNSVRPGITGWAQTNSKSGSSLQDEIENLKYDLYYIQHLSLLLDLKILMKTLRRGPLSRAKWLR
jgi:lipopolysaccharide/colanic/teichoic acid biosynthesis glycosyltransferase